MKFKIRSIPVNVRYLQLFVDCGQYGATISIRNTRWDGAYPGDTHFDHYASGLYLDAHLGVEYHISQKVGVYLDISTGISTLGLAFHL